LSVVNRLFAPITFAEQVVVVARRRVAARLALLAQTRLYPLLVVHGPFWAFHQTACVFNERRMTLCRNG